MKRQHLTPETAMACSFAIAACLQYAREHDRELRLEDLSTLQNIYGRPAVAAVLDFAMRFDAARIVVLAMEGAQA